MKRIVILLLAFNSLALSQGTHALRGTVRDSATGEFLGAANVRVLGTTRGTIANTRGSYALTLQEGEYRIMVSYLGYQPETLMVVLDRDAVRDFRLKASPITMAEMLVLAEDPAVDIIRRAIANKHAWMDKLKTYRFEAYSRELIRRDTGIASIMESYTTGYADSQRVVREIVLQKRQTKNVSASENFAAVRGIVNFNQDEIVLFTMTANGSESSYRFVGPTAPDALEYYDYRLLGTYRTKGLEVYKIRMTPRTAFTPLFDGTITIASGTYAVMGVDLKPNEALVVPFLRDISLAYRQQFALYDSLFWMPVDIRIDGGFSVSIPGISLPRIAVNLASTIYEYEINVPIPDSIMEKPAFTVDSASTAYDSTFWARHEVMPMTVEEQRAYGTLDSTETLEKQFQPKGPLASLTGDGGTSFLGYSDAHFNRVEGFFLGGKYESDLGRYVKLHGSAGYGFYDRRASYGAGAEFFATKKKEAGAGFEVYRKVDNIPDGGYYGPIVVSLMSLLDKNDYRDYFLARGARIFLDAKPLRTVEGRLTFISEKQEPLVNATYQSWFATAREYRVNPTAEDGMLRALRFDMRLGDEEVPLDLIPRDALELSIEHSSPSFMSSSFDYTLYRGDLTWHVRTFARRLLFAPSLRFHLGAGVGGRSLPPQRVFALDSRSSGYAPFGVLRGGAVKEFAGDRFVMLNAEHNFRSLPFQALGITFLHENNIEFILHGSLAQTWIGSASTSGGWYSEAGIGINRILELFRADLTWRLRDPKGVFFSLSMGNIF